MTNVVSMDKSVPSPGAPDANIVSLLEEWLEWAKAGDVRAIAIAGLFSDGTGTHAFVGRVGGPLIGAVELMKLDIAATNLAEG